MLDWIFEGIVTWISSVMTSLMDAVSGLFLDALGTDMVVMEEYFPFVTKAFGILQYTAWALLFLITAWQLFRAFGGPITDAENPLTLVARSILFAVMIGYAQAIFQMTLDIARAPYTALMEVTMTAEDFTFAGIEEALKNGLVTIVATTSIVGTLLLVILEIALGWNYFKLLLETVERYVVVGVLCYTSPLAFAMGGSKETNSVFRSWCRMVGSQLILLIMNVWFLRAFGSSVGQFIGNGGALTNGRGSIFLWLFCALAFLKCAQRFDSYLSSIGLNVAQTGSSMAMEMMMAARVLSGVGGGPRSAGSVFRGSGAAGSSATSTAAEVASGFANRFKGNSYVRDAVVNGGTRMGAGGSPAVLAERSRTGASRTTCPSLETASSRTRRSAAAGSVPHRSARMANRLLWRCSMLLSSTSESVSLPADEPVMDMGTPLPNSSVENSSASDIETPSGMPITEAEPQSFYANPMSSSNDSVSHVEDTPAADFVPVPDSGYHAETPEAPAAAPTSDYSSPVSQSDAAFTPAGSTPNTDSASFFTNSEVFSDFSAAYNQALFKNFMPGYEQPITSVDDSGRSDGHFEVRHADGSGTMFFDSTRYAEPRGDFKTMEDSRGGKWYAVSGQPAVERRPVYENGKPVYDGENVKTISVETVRYRNLPAKRSSPAPRRQRDSRTPKKKT